MKKFTKILLILTPIILLFHSLKGWLLILLFPLAIIMSLLFIPLNVLVRKLHAAYPHNPPWIYISFWWLILSFWCAFIFAPVLGNTESGWMVFGLSMVNKPSSPLAPFMTFLTNLSAVMIFAAIPFFILTIVVYSTARSKTPKVQPASPQNQEAAAADSSENITTPQ